MKLRLPAEWECQEFVMLAFPHSQTDWSYMLDEVCRCYYNVIHTILKYESVLVVCHNTDEVRNYLLPENNSDWQKDLSVNNEKMERFTNKNNISLILIEIETNDTWARDFGGITVFEYEYAELHKDTYYPINQHINKTVLDFGFNGWGLKFASNLDNLVTSKLLTKAKSIFAKHRYKDLRNIILEGGSIESDGQGTILTTEQCLLSQNRNYLSKNKIEKLLTKHLGANHFLWLKNGALQGDDTDSHIDTLARLCNENTITYIQCTDTSDPHYNELMAMEAELKVFKTKEGLPYLLIPLPMADEVIFEGERIPATYANFLIINDAVVMPSYNSPKDEIAKSQLEKAFPDRTIEMVNCLPLIKQHGSLHCITMQFPK